MHPRAHRWKLPLSVLGCEFGARLGCREDGTSTLQGRTIGAVVALPTEKWLRTPGLQAPGEGGWLGKESLAGLGAGASGFSVPTCAPALPLGKVTQISARPLCSSLACRGFLLSFRQGSGRSQRLRFGRRVDSQESVQSGSCRQPRTWGCARVK